MSVCLRKMIFFKQKTAYEMRISDWSSDVCSSDLRRVARALGHGDRQRVMPQRLAYPARPLPGNRRQGEIEAVARQLRASNGIRSEERRVGKECVRKCRSRGWQYLEKRQRISTKSHQIGTSSQVSSWTQI